MKFIISQGPNHEHRCNDNRKIEAFTCPTNPQLYVDRHTVENKTTRKGLIQPERLCELCKYNFNIQQLKYCDKCTNYEVNKIL